MSAQSESLRGQIALQRRNLSPAEQASWSSRLCLKFFRFFGDRDLSGALVALYRALPGEFDPSCGLEAELRTRGAILCYPRLVDRASGLLEMVAADPADAAQWEAGGYGALEPLVSLPAVDPLGLRLIVVPGVAFGPLGQRLGRGKGFYDRFLPRAPQALRVSLIFEFQWSGRIHENPWDQRVHWVLSEARESFAPGPAGGEPG